MSLSSYKLQLQTANYWRSEGLGNMTRLRLEITNRKDSRGFSDLGPPDPLVLLSCSSVPTPPSLPSPTPSRAHVPSAP